MLSRSGVKRHLRVAHGRHEVGGGSAGSLASGSHAVGRATPRVVVVSLLGRPRLPSGLPRE